MSKNIYNLYREYKKQLTDTHRTKFLASLTYETRQTLKNLSSYVENVNRFDNIYDGWVNSIEEEFIVLEVYSVILQTRKKLQKYCVDSIKYKNFITNKKDMLKLLLENQQYRDALNLLGVYMFNQDFKEKKLEELHSKVLEYLIFKKMVLPKKLIKEIYSWVDEMKLPTYLVADIQSDFSFTITNDAPSITSLEEDVKEALSNSIDMDKIVNNLALTNKVV